MAMGKISLNEYAQKHGRALVSVRQKAARGGFETAEKIGRNWIIDEDEPYDDARIKHGDLREEILSRHEHGESIRATARALGVSDGVVRKHLATEGIVSERGEEIRQMLAAGQTDDEIADALGVRRATINGHLPYRRSSYLEPSQTPVAIRIRQHRARKGEKNSD